MGLNFDALKTPAGFLKVLHVVLGTIIIGIVGYYTTQSDIIQNLKGGVIISNAYLYYLLVSFAFTLTSLLLLVSFLFDDTAEKVHKSHFELFYHVFGFIFYAAATITVIVNTAKIPSFARKGGPYAATIIALLCGLGNTVLYLGNAFFAFKAR